MQNSELQKAINAIKSGDKKAGYQLLTQVIKADPKGEDAETAWLWMSTLVTNPEKKRQCFNSVLKINPSNEIARKQIEQIHRQTKENNDLDVPTVDDIVPNISARNYALDQPTISDNIQKVEADQKQGVLSNSKILIFAAIIFLFGAIFIASLISSNLLKNRTTNQPAPTIAQVVQLPATYTPISNSRSSRGQPAPTRYITATPKPINTPFTQASEAGSNIGTSGLGFSGTEAEFQDYLQNKYDSISGQPLEIVDITIFRESSGSGIDSISIQLSSNSAVAFAQQSREDLTEYGRNLMQDAATYFGSTSYLIRVYELFYDDYLSDDYFNESWFYIGDYSVSRNAWPIYRDYIIGYYSDGYTRLDIWN